MPVLAWILAASTAMALIALSGSITLALPGPVAHADLVPELTTAPAPHTKAILTGGFAAGLLLLALLALLAH